MKQETKSQIGKFLLREVSNALYHYATHYHVFATEDMSRYATTRNFGLFHTHEVFVNGKSFRTEPSEPGVEHKHELIFNGKKITSGFPL